MQLIEIISLHSKIRHAPAKTITELFKSFAPAMLREILSEYVHFFSDRSNRERHLDPNNTSAPIHASILKKSITKLHSAVNRTFRNKPKFISQFVHLPTLLLSLCIAF